MPTFYFLSHKLKEKTPSFFSIAAIASILLLVMSAYLQCQTAGGGNINYTDGSNYEGQTKNGKRHGWGVMTYKDGTRYVGEWQNDAQEGRGTVYFADGSSFYGQSWKNGLNQDRGSFSWKNYTSATTGYTNNQRSTIAVFDQFDNAQRLGVDMFGTVFQDDNENLWKKIPQNQDNSSSPGSEGVYVIQDAGSISVRELPLTWIPPTIRFSSDGKMLAVSSKNLLTLIDVQTKKYVWQIDAVLRGAYYTITDIDFLDNGKSILVTSDDMSYRFSIIDVLTGEKSGIPSNLEVRWNTLSDRRTKEILMQADIPYLNATGCGTDCLTLQDSRLKIPLATLILPPGFPKTNFENSATVHTEKKLIAVYDHREENKTIHLYKYFPRESINLEFTKILQSKSFSSIASFIQEHKYDHSLSGLFMEASKVCNEMVESTFGLSTRFGFKQGKVGTRYKPESSNTYYDRQEYSVNGQRVTISKPTTYTSGGYNEEVDGYNAVFGIKNSSSNYYLVNCLISSTVYGKNYKWSDGLKLMGSNQHLVMERQILIKPGEEIKDAVPVGESQPSDFTISIVDVKTVSAEWTEGLGLVLSNKTKSVSEAQKLVSLASQYLRDKKAATWHESISEQRDENLKALISVEVSTKADYDKDYLNDITLTIRNNGLEPYTATVRTPSNGTVTVNINAGQSVQRVVQVQQIDKNQLQSKTSIISVR